MSRSKIEVGIHYQINRSSTCRKHNNYISKKIIQNSLNQYCHTGGVCRRADARLATMVPTARRRVDAPCLVLGTPAARRPRVTRSGSTTVVRGCVETHKADDLSLAYFRMLKQK